MKDVLVCRAPPFVNPAMVALTDKRCHKGMATRTTAGFIVAEVSSIKPDTFIALAADQPVFPPFRPATHGQAAAPHKGGPRDQGAGRSR
jgi:hypothetical protein